MTKTQKALDAFLKQFVFLNLDGPRSTLRFTSFLALSIHGKTSKVLNELVQILCIQTVGWRKMSCSEVLCELCSSWSS